MIIILDNYFLMKKERQSPSEDSMPKANKCSHYGASEQRRERKYIDGRDVRGNGPAKQDQ